MAKIDGQPLVDEEKEKAKIEWENKVLSYLMPIVGVLAVIVGIVGFVLTVNYNTGIAIFLILLAALGLGGIILGVLTFLKERKNKKGRKEKKEPEQE